ncbi:hypothetical protein [Telluria antibiotica]|uniref:hypothetical protein n=1 Tax=Telluria antibiotica TaxID=2717319 RepID=UPI001AAE4382|nr:hypothetical protein [Telluria antibiotica]
MYIPNGNFYVRRRTLKRLLTHEAFCSRMHTTIRGAQDNDQDMFDNIICACTLLPTDRYGEKHGTAQPDADAVTLEHIVEFYRALGGGQRDAGMDGSLRAEARLAIVPGTTHYDLLATTAVARLADEFL